MSLFATCLFNTQQLYILIEGIVQNRKLFAFLTLWDYLSIIKEYPNNLVLVNTMSCFRKIS